MPNHPRWIDTTDALAQFCRAAAAHDYVAFDTEFVRETTYYPILALVQLGTPEAVACIDPLAEGIDLGPLDELLLDRDTLKVLHSGRQDLEIFHQRLGEIPAPLFDTQVAAALLGIGEQVGYASLVQEICDVHIGKAHQRADWTRRPLSQPVIDYAAADVDHLRAVYRELRGRLEALGRTAWLAEEQAPLHEPETYEIPPDAAWLKVKGAKRLRGREAAIAQRLAAWREEEARRRNRPRRHVVADQIVIDIAKQKPKDIHALRRMRGIDKRMPQPVQEALVREAAAAAELPPDRWPEAAPRGPREKPDPALVRALDAVLTHCADRGEISSRMLANTADLERAAAGERDLPLFKGWRAELAGNAVAAFLAGERRLAVRGGELELATG